MRQKLIHFYLSILNPRLKISKLFETAEISSKKIFLDILSIRRVHLIIEGEDDLDKILLGSNFTCIHFVCCLIQKNNFDRNIYFVKAKRRGRKQKVGPALQH